MNPFRPDPGATASIRAGEGSLLAALIDLVIPPRCAGCDERGFAACPACTAELWRDPAPRPPDPPPPGLPECWSAARYEGAVRRMILACKERGRTAIVPVLGACVAHVTAAALAASGGWGGPVALVPVPSARAAFRKRGHDPVRAIATAAAARLREAGWPATAVPVLRQARRVADQAGLDSAQRAANLSGAFEAARGRAERFRPRGGPRPVVVLVDDIVTTGWTLAEAARAMRRTGADVPLAVTIAATRRRAGGRKRAGACHTPGNVPRAGMTQREEIRSRRLSAAGTVDLFGRPAVSQFIASGGACLSPAFRGFGRPFPPPSPGTLITQSDRLLDLLADIRSGSD